MFYFSACLGAFNSGKAKSVPIQLPKLTILSEIRQKCLFSFI